MADIYEGTGCNIAATKALDARGRCYSPRTVADVAPVLGPQSDHNYLLFDANIWNTNIRHSRMMKRGWVKQEQILSVRSLHVARTQVFW